MLSDAHGASDEKKFARGGRPSMGQAERGMEAGRARRRGSGVEAGAAPADAPLGPHDASQLVPHEAQVLCEAAEEDQPAALCVEAGEERPRRAV